MSNPLAGQGASPKGAEQAQAAIDEGRRIGAKTERERDYIEAVAAYYKDFATRPEKDRQVARAKAYEALAKRYPADDEAQIFSALYIAGTQTQADQTYAAYLKAAAILETQFRKYPDHPGVAHYLIHSYDAPPHRRQGAHRRAPLCGHRARRAARAAHALAHLHPRGLLAGVRRDERALDGCGQGGQRSRTRPITRSTTWCMRTCSSRAMPRLAAAIDEAMKVSGISPRFVAPLRHRRDAGALRLRARRLAGGGEAAAVRQHLSRSSRRSRTSRAASARRAAATSPRPGRMPTQLETLHKALLAAKNNYWATEVEVQRLAAAGWIALGEGQVRRGAQVHARGGRPRGPQREAHRHAGPRRSRARAARRNAARSCKQPAAALKEFEASQQREPNRFRNYLGSARAAEMAGDRAKAAAYYQKLVALAKDADTARPELVAAKAFAQR